MIIKSALVYKLQSIIYLPTTMSEKLMRDIIKSRAIIRKKFNTLKHDKNMLNVELSETFQPITKPLEQIIEATKINNQQNEFFKLKPEYNAHQDHNSTKHFFHPKKLQFNALSTPESVYSSPSVSPSLHNDFITPTNLDESKYMKLFKSPHTPRGFDNSKYGPYYDNSSNTWKIGNSNIDVSDTNDTIIIGNNEYKKTDGLYELIFMKKPNDLKYTNADLDAYKKIIDDTLLHKRDFKSNTGVMKNQSYKYINIIRKLLTIRKSARSKTGRGISPQIKYSNNKLDFVYWDNPNELVNRLRLLISSQQAGHTNHNNEIISIIEELREAKIII